MDGVPRDCALLVIDISQREYKAIYLSLLMLVPVVVALDKIVSYILFWFCDSVIPCTHCGCSWEKQVILFSMYGL